MIGRAGIWDFFSVVVKLGSNPAVKSKTNFTCAVSDPSCVRNGKIRLHPVRCWNMGNWTNPRAMLIKAELCQAGLINKGPETPQMRTVRDQTQSAPRPWLRGARSPVWSTTWTLLAPAQMPTTDFDHVALSATGFQANLKLSYFHEQWQKGEIREKKERPPNSNHMLRG